MLSYYINLDRRTDRRNAVEQQFAAAKLAAHRISAITPADLTQEHFALYCPPTHDEPLAPVELSCTLSHRLVMEKFLATKEQYAAVFEDDIIVNPELARVLARIDSEGMPCDLLKLETFNERVQFGVKPVGAIDQFTLHTMQGWHWGAAGYVINRKAAEHYLSDPTLGQMIIDHIIWRELPDQKPVKALQLFPALVMQEDRQDISERKGSDLEIARQQRSENAQKRTIPQEARRFWRYEVKVALPALIHRTLKLSHRTTVPFAGSGVAPESNKA
jgi:glycosyl transferase family 25